MFCTQTMQETAHHIFESCPYARHIWNDILPNNTQSPASMLDIPRIITADHTTEKTQFTSLATTEIRPCMHR
jgi:hypothetical protein